MKPRRCPGRFDRSNRLEPRKLSELLLDTNRTGNHDSIDVTSDRVSDVVTQFNIKDLQGHFFLSVFRSDVSNLMYVLGSNTSVVMSRCS